MIIFNVLVGKFILGFSVTKISEDTSLIERAKNGLLLVQCGLKLQGELIADDERAAMIDAVCSAIELLETINQEKVVKQLSG